MAKFLRLLAWALLIAGALVGLLRVTAIRWWQVPLNDPYLDASIEPTLHGGDWIILWRATAPGAGDLALCPEPKAAGRQVLGRMVGMQGARLKLQKEAVTLDGKQIDHDSNCDRFKAKDPATGLEVDQGCASEVIADKTHLMGLLSAGSALPGEADVEVPAGQVFLASDNRQFPWDSRDFGMVERSTCLESVVFRLVSKDGFFDVANRFTLIH